MSRRRSLALAATLALLCFAPALLAGVSEDRLWAEADPRARAALAAFEGEREIVPDAYRVFRADVDALRQRLADAPPEGPGGTVLSSVTMTLPFPDGTFQRFRVVESSIMDPLLQAKFPEIRTYRGFGLDDPTATVRLDLTPAGFHAMVLRAGGTVFLDPYRRGDRANVISYHRSDFTKKDDTFSCGVTSDPEALAARVAPMAAGLVSAGPTLRTYRLALGASVEYSTYHGGTKPLVMAALTTTMNRVNGVYERDVAVRMVFVDKQEELIFLAEPDGYTNGNPGRLLTENRTKLEAVIGSANYDIGHVFTTQSGGLAGLGVVCLSGQKSAGTTGVNKPVGDPFDIDYVAHEMGHQFGANHPFNGSTGSCGGGNREPGAAYEPGSGSTIMAYAGICSSEDLQRHSDDYFHAKSLEEILQYIESGARCSSNASTGNTSPIVSAGGTFTIPKETPFLLTASASDGDAADAGKITYCWEEYDLGPEGPPNTDDGKRPIFRSYLPTTSPSRSFPSMVYVLANANVPPETYKITGSSRNWLTGESLPKTDRTMIFRVTARDNRPRGETAAGGMSMAETSVKVVTSAGPFRVTAPNTAVTWAVPSTQSVTWDAAGTAAAPVSASEVRILLSTDGGLTFPLVLADRTANDGNESIAFPRVDSDKARVKIEAVGNVFFDVSDVDFKVQSPNAAPTVTITSPSGDPNPEAGAAVVFTGAGVDPDGDTLAYSWSFGDGTAPATGASVNHPFANAGSYVVTLTVTDPRGATATATRTVTVKAPTLTGASLLVPVVLETAGAGGSFYSTELTLVSRASSPVDVLLAYTASAGGGSGFARLTLAPGEQRIVSGVIAALRGLSVPIASDATSKVGTLLLTFGGASQDLVFAGARTYTRDPSGGAGTFGLFYTALPSTSDTLTLFGLQQNTAQRSNVALINAGASTITLRVRLVGPSGQELGSVDQTLGAWGWAQLNSPLEGKAASGRAVVTRVAGSSPFTAYGVLNDAKTSDGSFIPPLLPGASASAERLVPIVLSTGGYRTELTVANERTSTLALTFVYTGSPQLSAQGSGTFARSYGPSEQAVIPDAIGFLRENGLNVPAAGSSAGGSLLVRAPGGTPSSAFAVGARTFIGAASGGTFGLFYPGLTLEESATGTAFIYGLQQNAVQRSNLALLNRGDAGDSITLRVTYYTAAGVASETTDTRTLAPGEWGQFNSPLASRGMAAGYAKVERLSGSSRFLVYGVLNDQVNSDGSYVPMVK